jgi:hypothetical protein
MRKGANYNGFLENTVIYTKDEQDIIYQCVDV